jgi:integrase
MANKRRDKGDGSVRQRTNGSWEGRFSYTDNLTGKRVVKSVYAPSQPEVKRKLKKLINNIEETASSDNYVTTSNIKLSDWLDTWMRDYKKNSIRPTTYEGYWQSINNHIKPALGNVELQKLRPEHIQNMLNNLSRGSIIKKTLAPWTVIKAKNIMSGAMEQALRNRIIPYNPVRATVPPKLVQKEIRVLTEDEQKQFMDAVKGHRHEALFLLALATGMRRGEIMALTWDCVDYNTMSIAVKGSITRTKDPDTGITSLQFSEPKTKSGRRQIPILSNMIPILHAHKQRQDAEKAAASSAWNPKNLVFCSNVGTVLEPRRINTTMNKITDAAKLPRFTFHSLRHSFATRMLEANVSAKVVQDILGHADVALTLNTYSHVVGTTAHDQMAKIDCLFQNACSSKESGKNKPSIRDQLTEAKNMQQAAVKSPHNRSIGKNEPEL